MNIWSLQNQRKPVEFRRGKDREINFESARSNAEKLEPEKAEAILSWDFNLLRKKLQNGDVSCTDVLRAYQSAALSSTERTNCVCMFVEDNCESFEVCPIGIDGLFRQIPGGLASER
ncbi:hypothetical protein ANCDUO_23668 [Ancylostoma duodenale]|uniref:Uncharacterized protein n=1 Tax=Ancylostoma duodenale TaxID=51022 RepID=A0A0C2C925_9BILA|nr:hypothetical protein ANCDUO_23668 [Ancylostoma duodenale]